MSSENKKQKLSSSSSRGFQSWWTEDYGMICSNDKAVCVLCSNTVVCRTSSVKRHFETNHKDLNLKAKEEQKQVISKALKEKKIQSSNLMKFIGGSSNVTAASYIVSNEIAKHGKPFSDGQFIKQAWLECAPVLFENFKEKEKIIQRIKEILLSRNTVKVRILDMADNVSHQQSTDITSCDSLSICLDESTDVTGSARLAIFGRYLVGDTIKEELISLASLKTTRGIDICDAVVKDLSEKKVDLSKIVSVSTDGACSMTGKENGFINLFTQHVGHSILSFHCIIHQQALCAKTAFKSLQEVMNVVTKLINLISVRGLNKRKFQQLLSAVDSIHGGLLMYNNVRWLSRGKVLQRFVECLDEVILFLTTEKLLQKYKELSDGQWILKLMFFTDLCLHVNELNSGLQGRNKTIITMFDLIKAFAAKLQVFYRDVASKSFKYFKNTKEYFSQLESNDHPKQELDQLIKVFCAVIQELIDEFASRFTQFREFAETTQFILRPDLTSLETLNLESLKWLDLEDMEMQLIEFQSNSIWKQKFIDLRSDLALIENDRALGVITYNAEEKVLKTWNAIPDTFICLKRLAIAILSIFSSTYCCESLFSQMNLIKNDLRSRMVDDSSSACILLKVTEYEPDIKHLASKVQHQKSH